MAGNSGFPYCPIIKGDKWYFAGKEMLKLSFISNISFFDPKTFKDKRDFFRWFVLCAWQRNYGHLLCGPLNQARCRCKYFVTQVWTRGFPVCIFCEVRTFCRCDVQDNIFLVCAAEYYNNVLASELNMCARYISTAEWAWAAYERSGGRADQTLYIDAPRILPPAPCAVQCQSCSNTFHKRVRSDISPALPHPTGTSLSHFYCRLRGKRWGLDNLLFFSYHGPKSLKI